MGAGGGGCEDEDPVLGMGGLVRVGSARGVVIQGGGFSAEGIVWGRGGQAHGIEISIVVGPDYGVDVRWCRLLWLAWRWMLRRMSDMSGECRTGAEVESSFCLRIACTSDFV